MLGREAVLLVKEFASGAEFSKKFHEITEISIDGIERLLQRPEEIERQIA